MPDVVMPGVVMEWPPMMVPRHLQASRRSLRHRRVVESLERSRRRSPAPAASAIQPSRIRFGRCKHEGEEQRGKNYSTKHRHALSQALPHRHASLAHRCNDRPCRLQ
jgi:hypothetical protein